MLYHDAPEGGATSTRQKGDGGAGLRNAKSAATEQQVTVLVGRRGLEPKD
jgi:hypothetical protein